MSDSDSFIDEVSEEVRREKLFGYLKTYGWIAALAIVAIVGGAAYNEWRKSTAQAAAQERGDAVLEALALETPADRGAALAGLDASGESAAVIAMLLAAEQEGAGDAQAAVDTLQSVAAMSDARIEYRQLAEFKALVLARGLMDDATRRDAFVPLATAGGPYRLLAQEQIAMIDLDIGDVDGATAGLREIAQDAEVTTNLRERALSMIVALGGDISDLPASQ